MNYKEIHNALLELKLKLEADGQLKSSYVAVLSGITSTVASLAKMESKTPVLDKLRKNAKEAK